MELKTLQFRAFKTPDGKPTCRNNEGVCHFLDVDTQGGRYCDYAKRAGDGDFVKLYFYDDDVLGYLVPHRVCILNENGVL